jgi:hypothetical protein
MPLRPTLAALAFLWATVACGGADPTAPAGRAGGKADGLEPIKVPRAVAAFPDPDAVDLARRSTCLNSFHQVGTYDPATFDSAGALAALRALDEARGCPERIYSRSRAEGIAGFEELLADRSYQDAVVDCKDGFVDLPGIPDPAAFDAEWRALVGAKSNRGVFSSVQDPDGVEDPIGCHYYRYLVFRRDGTAVYVDYDFSD